MGMTYQEFKDHILVFLWKQNDQDLIRSLDKLIDMANSELNVLLNISDNETTDVIYASVDSIQMPSGFKSVRLVSSPQLGEMTYLKPSDLFSRRTANDGATLPYYSLQGNIMFLIYSPSPNPPPSGDDRLPVVLTYNRDIPDFKTTNESWLTEKYLALYTYAVLLQTAPFLREDERVQLWMARFQQLVETLKEEDAFYRVRGTSGETVAQSPSSVSISKNRGGWAWP